MVGLIERCCSFVESEVVMSKSLQRLAQDHVRQLNVKWQAEKDLEKKSEMVVRITKCLTLIGQGRSGAVLALREV